MCIVREQVSVSLQSAAILLHKGPDCRCTKSRNSDTEMEKISFFWQHKPMTGVLKTVKLPYFWSSSQQTRGKLEILKVVYTESTSPALYSLIIYALTNKQGFTGSNVCAALRSWWPVYFCSIYNKGRCCTTACFPVDIMKCVQGLCNVLCSLSGLSNGQINYDWTASTVNSSLFCNKG